MDNKGMHAAVVQAEVRTGRPNHGPPKGWRRFLSDMSEKAFLLTQRLRSLMAEEIVECYQLVIDEIENKLTEWINFSGLNNEGRRFGDTEAPGSLLKAETKLALRKDLGETRGVSRLRRRQWHRIESVDECPVCFDDSGVRTFVFWDGISAIDHSIEYGDWERDLVFEHESNDIEMFCEPNKIMQKTVCRVLKTEYQAFWKSLNRTPNRGKIIKRKLNLEGLSTKARKDRLMAAWRAAFERNQKDTSRKL